MSSLNALTQAQRCELRAGTALLLVEISLSSTTLRLCDRSFRYIYGSSQLLYEPYLLSVSGITGTLDIFGTGNNNPSVQVTCRNEIYGDAGQKLCLLDQSQPFIRAAVTIYELRLISMDETFSSDVRTIIWKGNVEQLSNITEQSFVINCGGRLASSPNSINLHKVTKVDFPYADEADIGAYHNVLYGDLEMVPARCVATGGDDTLALAMAKTGMTATISGVATQPPMQPSGTIQIDMEQMTYSQIINNVMTITARGVNGTTASSHIAGADVYQILTQFIYELSQHPVKSVDAVYVDDILQPASAYTVYTGQSGSQLGTYGGRAMIVFTVSPKITQQINVGVNYGSHTHQIQTNSQVTVSGVSTTNTAVTNPGFAIDGNKATCANMSNGISAASLAITLAGDNSGQIVSAQVNITWSCTGSGTSATTIKLGTATLVTIPANTAIAQGDYTYQTTDTAHFDWTSKVTISIGGAQNTYVNVYDVTVIFTFQGSLASNSDTTQISTANMVIGAQVCADVQGTLDDASGTYTGTPNALIERPDQIMVHRLCATMGYSMSADIGTSFAASGAMFAALGYKFAFILHDVGTDGPSLFSSLAMQCRSVFYDWAGQFQLTYLPDTAPSSDIVLSSDMDIEGFPQFDFSSIGDVKNQENIYYRRDYPSQTNSQQVVGFNKDAIAKGYMDMLTSTYGAGELPEDLLLTAVRLSAMAQSVGDFIRTWKQAPKMTVTLTAQWFAVLAGLGKVFSLTDAIYGTNTYLISTFTPHSPDLGQVAIVGTFLGTGGTPA